MRQSAIPVTMAQSEHALNFLTSDHATVLESPFRVVESFKHCGVLPGARYLCRARRDTLNEP